MLCSVKRKTSGKRNGNSKIHTQWFASLSCSKEMYIRRMLWFRTRTFRTKQYVIYVVNSFQCEHVECMRVRVLHLHLTLYLVLLHLLCSVTIKTVCSYARFRHYFFVASASNKISGWWRIERKMVLSQYHCAFCIALSGFSLDPDGPAHPSFISCRHHHLSLMKNTRIYFQREKCTTHYGQWLYFKESEREKWNESKRNVYREQNAHFKCMVLLHKTDDVWRIQTLVLVCTVFRIFCLSD